MTGRPSSAPVAELSCRPVLGVGEVRPGDDLADLLRDRADLRDGDVLVVTSKVVSKAEGRTTDRDRDEAVAAETDRVVARRGGTTIARTHHGLVLASAGVDASNVEPGTLVLLPADPDASAAALREDIGADGGPNVAVVVGDTAGRAWRAGQTEMAIGLAGLPPLLDHAGRSDAHGNRLTVTAPAVADELAATADLVAGKLSGCPAVVVRGLRDLVLPRHHHGPGATALVRPEDADMFGLGAREAVRHALAGSGRRGFGAPAPPEVLVDALGDIGVAGTVAPDGAVEAELAAGAGREGARRQGADAARSRALAHAHGWACEQHDRPGAGLRLRFRPDVP
jgi:coenzyme F420-0:L-glutamate ligase/coenzyme F420-1:gamma-L-glutamate ligase